MTRISRMFSSQLSFNAQSGLGIKVEAGVKELGRERKKMTKCWQ